MPKHLNVSDSSFERDKIADDLYNKLGAEDARQRESINAHFGSNDLLQTLCNSLELEQSHTIIDVGCGSGKHLEHFCKLVGQRGQAIGIDFSIDAANNTTNLGLDCIAADGSMLPLKDESADAINCAYAIYYFHDIEATIEEFFRVLKPTGKLVVCGPSQDTNKELYNFHKELTGKSPSDADLMALGFVQNKVKHLAEQKFDSVSELTFINQVNFPEVEDFINYWKSTSLVRRTVLDTDITGFISQAKTLLDKGQDTLSITKKTSIVVASK